MDDCRSIWYAQCARNCRQQFNCSAGFGTFDWVHGDCFWCRHNCMWDVVEKFESNFGTVPQFHGKWPFLAVPLPFGLIIQEPASLLFSLLNLLSVFKMLQMFKKIQNLPNRGLWITYAHVGVATWIASSVFHMFDCDVTEKLDYFGAFAFVLSAFYVSIIFTLPQLEYSRTGRIFRKTAPYAFVLKFLYHVRSMMILCENQPKNRQIP
uniref:Post-GPI attachment to proteins factor 3 n=1 Tax=Caenorhabditis japonica TaxID=281687 RepID=A0A8R1IKX2_CAEJA